MKIEPDLELLRIEIEMLFDQRGRVEDRWGLTIATTSEGQLLFVGSPVEDDVTQELKHAFDASTHDRDPTMEPPALRACEAVITARELKVERGCGPHYLFPPGTTFEPPSRVVRSDVNEVAPLRDRNPGNWAADEWNELLDGKLGPWAMAVVDERIVSIAHTPRRMTNRAAECGVWTDADFRGRGHAASVAAAWSRILEPTGRHLFYSTSHDNRSSQAVATRRLKLREIGWTWTLTRATAR